MKIQRALVALTVVNLGLVLFVLAQMRPVEARGEAPVLRGRALEIVDRQGRVRASIQVLPSATTHPETVILRLIDPNGRPSVKLTASVQGAGLGLGGESDATYATLSAIGADSALKLTNKAGQQQIVTP
jgi:hypothetical protein